MDTAPHISQEPTTTPKPIKADRLDALLQMQRTDPFCKHISRRLLNGRAPHHEFDTFTHVKGLLYKHIPDAGKKFLTYLFPNLGSTQYWWKPMINQVIKEIPTHIVSSNPNTIGKVWIRTFRNTLPTVSFADERKLRFSSIQYRWQRYQIDHLVK